MVRTEDFRGTSHNLHPSAHHHRSVVRHSKILRGKQQLVRTCSRSDDATWKMMRDTGLFLLQKCIEFLINEVEKYSNWKITGISTIWNSLFRMKNREIPCKRERSETSFRTGVPRRMLIPIIVICQVCFSHRLFLQLWRFLRSRWLKGDKRYRRPRCTVAGNYYDVVVEFYGCRSVRFIYKAWRRNVKLRRTLSRWNKFAANRNGLLNFCLY